MSKCMPGLPHLSIPQLPDVLTRFSQTCSQPAYLLHVLMEAEQLHPSPARPCVAGADKRLSSCNPHPPAHVLQVLVEAERLRPGLEGLLALADYVVTSAHYPQVHHIACSTAAPRLLSFLVDDGAGW